MLRKAALLAAFLGVLAGAPLAHASELVKRPAVTWVRGDGSFTKASRGKKQIHTIVIHATDGGSLLGNVWWLSGGHSHASAHYVVSRDGSIVQLVHLSDIAWHAGNWRTNVHSIGIEHVGETYDPAGFTKAEYAVLREARRLARAALRRSPSTASTSSATRRCRTRATPRSSAARTTTPIPARTGDGATTCASSVSSPSPTSTRCTSARRRSTGGDTLTGIEPWRVTTKGDARRVDFLVDGEVLWSDSRRPFAFAAGHGWNTTRIANGTHVLALRVTGGGRTAWKRWTVRIVNHDFALTTSKLRPWQKVSGLLRIRANVRGAKTTGIGLYVDGKVISRDRAAPFTLRWNSHRVADGRHRITLAAIALDGRVAKRTLPLVVSNRVHHTHARRQAETEAETEAEAQASARREGRLADRRRRLDGRRRRRLARPHDRADRAAAVRRRRHGARNGDAGAVEHVVGHDRRRGRRARARGPRAREGWTRRRVGDRQRDGGAASAGCGSGCADALSLEREHQLPQQRVQLLLLRLRQRRGEERLAPALHARGLVPGALALLRQLDDDAATIVGIAQATDVARLLEPVEPARHRAARELHVGRQLTGRAAMVAPPEPERPQHLKVGMRQAVLREGRLHPALDALVDARDAVDDRLDVEVDVDVVQRLQALEQTVDVVEVAVRHRAHLDSKDS